MTEAGGKDMCDGKHKVFHTLVGTAAFPRGMRPVDRLAEVAGRRGRQSPDIESSNGSWSIIAIKSAIVPRRGMDGISGLTCCTQLFR